jgi:hypothetical protein
VTGFEQGRSRRVPRAIGKAQLDAPEDDKILMVHERSSQAST